MKESENAMGGIGMNDLNIAVIAMRGNRRWMMAYTMAPPAAKHYLALLAHGKVNELGDGDVEFRTAKAAAAAKLGEGDVEFLLKHERDATERDVLESLLAAKRRERAERERAELERRNAEKAAAAAARMAAEQPQEPPRKKLRSPKKEREAAAAAAAAAGRRQKELAKARVDYGRVVREVCLWASMVAVVAGGVWTWRNWDEYFVEKPEPTVVALAESVIDGVVRLPSGNVQDGEGAYGCLASTPDGEWLLVPSATLRKSCGAIDGKGVDGVELRRGGKAAAVETGEMLRVEVVGGGNGMSTALFNPQKKHFAAGACVDGVWDLKRGVSGSVEQYGKGTIIFRAREPMVGTGTAIVDEDGKLVALVTRFLDHARTIGLAEKVEEAKWAVFGWDAYCHETEQANAAGACLKAMDEWMRLQPSLRSSSADREELARNVRRIRETLIAELPKLGAEGGSLAAELKKAFAAADEADGFGNLFLKSPDDKEEIRRIGMLGDKRDEVRLLLSAVQMCRKAAVHGQWTFPHCDKNFYDGASREDYGRLARTTEGGVELLFRRWEREYQAAADGVDVTRAFAFVKTDRGEGSGVLITLDGETYLYTCRHVAELTQKFEARMVSGERLELGGLELPHDGRDMLRAKVTGYKGLSLKGAKMAASAIGDRLLAYGNAMGGGVMTKNRCRLIGVGPELLEMEGGNLTMGDSGGPILDMKNGVLGLITKGADPFGEMDESEWKWLLGDQNSEVRRFGTRADNVEWKPTTMEYVKSRGKVRSDLLNAVEGIERALMVFRSLYGKMHKPIPESYNEANEELSKRLRRNRRMVVEENGRYVYYYEYRYGPGMYQIVRREILRGYDTGRRKLRLNEFTYPDFWEKVDGFPENRAVQDGRLYYKYREPDFREQTVKTWLRETPALYAALKEVLDGFTRFAKHVEDLRAANRNIIECPRKYNEYVDEWIREDAKLDKGRLETDMQVSKNRRAYRAQLGRLAAEYKRSVKTVADRAAFARLHRAAFIGGPEEFFGRIGRMLDAMRRHLQKDAKFEQYDRDALKRRVEKAAEEARKAETWFRDMMKLAE